MDGRKFEKRNILCATLPCNRNLNIILIVTPRPNLREFQSKTLLLSCNLRVVFFIHLKAKSFECIKVDLGNPLSNKLIVLGYIHKLSTLGELSLFSSAYRNIFIFLETTIREI